LTSRATGHCALWCETAIIAIARLETYEIIRRRLFQSLDSDSDGERARDETIEPFHDLYKEKKNAADSPRPYISGGRRFLILAPSTGVDSRAANRASRLIAVSRIVSCRATTRDPRKSVNPLAAQLLAEGHARRSAWDRRRCQRELRAYRHQRARLKPRLRGWPKRRAVCRPDRSVRPRLSAPEPYREPREAERRTKR
jgi:hypothetical protein